MEQQQNHPGNNVTQAVPFLMVRNIQKSLDFYARSPGYTVLNKWIRIDHIDGVG